jgi:hypothetical protein
MLHTAELVAFVKNVTYEPFGIMSLIGEFPAIEGVDEETNVLGDEVARVVLTIRFVFATAVFEVEVLPTFDVEVVAAFKVTEASPAPV